MELVVTREQARELALALPEAVEQDHHGRPSFRVGGRIFATLHPDLEWGMVKLTPEQQKLFVRSEPQAFQPIKGGWGKRGATQVILETATEPSVRQALEAAWRNTAPNKLLKELDEESK